jgi:hypothetical protein
MPPGKRSTIITFQLPVVNWNDIIGEQTIDDYPHFFIMQRNILTWFDNQPNTCQ